MPPKFPAIACDHLAMPVEGETPREVWRMRIDLDAAPARAPAWPRGARVQTYGRDDAARVHALLRHAYRAAAGGWARSRGGFAR